MTNISINRKMARMNGIDIFYRDTSPASTDGPAILCLHGRWGRGETWVNFMLHYGDRYRIIAPDQRGHGLSSKPLCRYTAEEMDADMLALLDHLGIEQAIVVGHSMGGLNAGWLAANYPDRVRAVAILDKSANGPEAPNTTPLEDLPLTNPVTSGWPLPFKTLKEARETIMAGMEGSDLAYEYFLESLVETEFGYEFMFSLQAIAANITYYQSWFHLLPKITCPAMLVRTSSHEAVPDEDWIRMQTLIADCSAYEMSHPDHNVYLSNEEEFYGYFDDFLSKVDQARKANPVIGQAR